MTLAAGRKLGPYEIQETAGAGGMGEVYRARDTRLDRAVAIKVLPAHLAENPELRQRLEREARAVSSLSHPHVCALYDLGHHDGIDYLVMEYLDGETLAQRLARGPLPSEELLRFAVQIAGALDKAHRAGLIHRDLKPGNIMLTKDGAKLLDFGLAKLEGPTADADATASPTVSQPLTEAGTVLGTYQYMAPEQLEGKGVDARTDIFALGAVMYEMATADRAFPGNTQASVIGAVLHSKPRPVTEVQPMIPPALDRVIQTCLAKDPDQRWQTAHDVKLQLEWIAEGGSMVGLPAPISSRRRRREWFGWTAFAVALAVAAVFAAGFFLRAPKPQRQVRFEITAPPDLTFVGSPRISPDGRIVAFRATDSRGETRIWLRPLDSLQAYALPGTESGSEFRPIWSPDSRHIAFFSGGKLKKISVEGGPAQTICDANGADGSWSASGDIVFDGQLTDPLRRVAASGGVPKDEVKPDPGTDQVSVAWPEFLPDGGHILYLASKKDGGSRLMFYSIGQEGATEVVESDSRVQYVKPGYLLYIRDDSLVAQPFDADKGVVTGEPRPVADQVSASGVGLADFSASADGTLVYRSQGAGLRRLLWRDRSGREIEAVGQPAVDGTFALSPDGSRMAVDVYDDQSDNRDLWIRDLDRGVASRFTFDPAPERSPVWSPDGRRIVFSSTRGGGSYDLYMKDASGAGEAEKLLADEQSLHGCDWSRDGTFLAYMRLDPDKSWDIWALPMDPQGDPFPVVDSPFLDGLPSFSPDGRWIAYQSSESGRPEVYVRPFPGPGGKWQVSTAGGMEPHWSADGREIIYLDAAQQLASVAVETGATVHAGIPTTLFEARLFPVIQRNRFAVSSDGQRFLLLSPLESQTNPPNVVIMNWSSSLDR